MQTRDDLFTQVLVRNNRTTTDGFITDTILKAWYKDAYIWAASFRKWPFTEERDASTTWSGTEEIPYSTFAPEYKSDSIRILTVGGKRFKKTNYEDYLTFREEQPSSTERVFTDFNRSLFINPVAGVTGTLYVYGQAQPPIDVTNETETTVFSTYDSEGNEAIYEKMSSYLKRREHLADEAELHDQRAAAKLDEIWTRIRDEQYKYQAGPSSSGLFSRVDVVDGGFFQDNFRRDQF